jgi:hypothetical protein
MRLLRAWLASVSVATALLAGPGLAWAAIPTGSFEILFGGHQSIWTGETSDLNEEFCEGFAESFDVLESCDFDLFVDGRGELYGYFGFAAWVDGVHFVEGGPIRGRQRGDDRSGISRVSLKIKLKGTASDGLETLLTRSSLRLSGQVTAEGLMSGVWIVRVCIQGVGCNENESLVTPGIAENGEWSLQIEITDEGDDRLGGNARVEFGNGEECLYSVSGRYSSTKDTARLRLDPTEPDCAGTSLRLKDVHLLVGPPDQIAGSIAYRLFGFRGDTSFPDLARLNQQLFRFICRGTVEIAASVDPSACSWSAIPNGFPPSREELAERQWTLAEELQRALDEGPRFGRREFLYLEQQPLYGYQQGTLGGYSASATITVIGTLPPPTYIEPEVREPLLVEERLRELQPQP